jgi:Ni/Fe-hydrogenase subunit HybB-like protein
MFLTTTYQDTANLKSFPSEKRFSIYRQAHKMLMATDRRYHLACRQFSIIISGLALLSVAPQIFLLFGWLPQKTGVILSIVIGVISVLLLILVALLAQHFRNISIARVIDEDRNEKLPLPDQESASRSAAGSVGY